MALVSDTHKYEQDTVLKRRRVPRMKNRGLTVFLSKAIYVVLVTSVLFVVTPTGCQNVMSNPRPYDDEVVQNKFPLKFVEHDFGAYCFNATGCKVLYADFYEVHDGENELSDPPQKDYLENLNGSYGGIKNFPPPAVVTWRSLDGVPHEAKVDIGAIFKDERVLHHVPERDIYVSPEPFSGPEIILVVNDRTISVYMKTTIYLKEPNIPSNPYSFGINETTLAYTHSY
jgi:hypothetical protein